MQINIKSMLFTGEAETPKKKKKKEKKKAEEEYKPEEEELAVSPAEEVRGVER